LHDVLSFLDDTNNNNFESAIEFCQKISFGISVSLHAYQTKSLSHVEGTLCQLSYIFRHLS